MSPSPTSLLIRGGRLADGTGAAPRDADVLLAGGLVEAIEPPGAVSADGRAVLDAGGRIVAPGFIDAHSHADNAPLLPDDDTTKILQGITTEVVGNCGFSLAPVTAGHDDELRRLLERLFPPMSLPWSSVGELFDALDAPGSVTNWVPLVGHNSLRVAAAGTHDRPLSASERAVAERLLDEALEAGAFGISSGLIYPPGLFASTDELVGFCARLPAGRVYATHMRDEATGLLDSIAETIAIGERAGCRVQVSHLKAVGQASWGLVDGALAQLDAARGRGLQVGQDMYPYEATSTMLTVVLPPWCQDGGPERLLERLGEPTALRRARAELDGRIAWEAIMIASSASHTDEGRMLVDVAADMGGDPFDALVAVLTRERLRVSMVRFAMNEADIETVLRHPSTMIGSDGLPPGVGGRPHPRLFGTFPRVLGRYVRERAVLDVGEAVARMTSLPAAAFGLEDRGVLVAGKVADVVVFDPARVDEGGDYRDPVQPPVGITHVVQAGHVVVSEGRWCGVRHGRRLTP